jgi:hypothetical protein
VRRGRHWEYEFVCPVRSQPVRLRALTWSRFKWPRSTAVPARPVDTPGEEIR